MTRAELVKKLRETAEIMASTANSMYFYGRLSDEARSHAAELAGAAEIVGEWADALERKNE